MVSDKKDYIISLLTQQRDEANNRLVTLAAEANAKIDELKDELSKLKDETVA